MKNIVLSVCRYELNGPLFYEVQVGGMPTMRATTDYAQAHIEAVREFNQKAQTSKRLSFWDGTKEDGEGVEVIGISPAHVLAPENLVFPMPAAEAAVCEQGAGKRGGAG